MATPTQPGPIPLTRMRRAIARAMTASALVPQFTIEAEARLDALAALRESVAASGSALSYSDAFTAACAHTLTEHPHLNASFTGEGIVHHADVNIGIALSLDDGLVAPAIRNADRLNLTELAGERVRLTQAAQNGTLSAEDLLSATFTISNLGPLGIRRFRALVVPPQAAILAVGRTTADLECSLSLSCDHRLLDGTPAARFLMDVVARLEQPGWLAELVGVL